MNRILRVRPTLWTIVTATLSLALILGAVAFLARADLVEMQNGDRYVGKVLSLNTNTLVLQSEVLGTLRLPRAQVSSIKLGADVGTNLVPPPSTNILRSAPAASASSTEFSTIVRQLGVNSNLINEIQAQFLAGAGPEAQAKFNDLLSGLLSGRLTLNDLRSQARSAADQLRAARKDLGEDSGLGFDSYLAILDAFLDETAPPATAPTNSPAPRTPVSPAPASPGKR